MLLETKDLLKNYSRGGRILSAVNKVNFNVESGDFINIIGRSGSGKSTLLNLISGLLTPTSGQVILNGENISDKTDKEISFVRNDLMGYIPQGTGTIPTLNIIDNIVLPFYLYKRSGDAYGYGMHLLQRLGIKDMAYSYPKHLSGGENKRVLIARALMNKPKILIADEPTANLDVESTHDVMNIFSEINEDGTTVLLVSHELDTLAYGKRCYTMKEGNIAEGNSLLNA